MVSPRSTTSWACVVVLVVGLIAVLLQSAAAQEDNKILTTITTTNSGSNDGLVQFHFKFNASYTDRVQFRLNDPNCPIDNTNVFTSPYGAYSFVSYYSTCTTKKGRISDYYMSSGSLCQVNLNFPVIDKEDDVSCWIQWNQPATTVDIPPISLELDESYSDSALLTLAAPVELTPPLSWAVAPGNYTFGNVTIKFIQGKDLLWSDAPKEMTKDKIVIAFKNAKLEPFSQYELNRLRLRRDGSNWMNILSQYEEFQMFNAYVGKDIRLVQNENQDYFLVTAAAPAANFQIEATFCNYLTQFTAANDFTMASVSPAPAGGGDEEHDNDKPLSRSKQQRPHRKNTYGPEEVKALFEQQQRKQQQHAALAVEAQSTHQILQTTSELTLYVRMYQFNGDAMAEATSDPIKVYKYHELWPQLTSSPYTTISTRDNNNTIAITSSFNFYATKQNYTIDVAMSGYQGGFKNAQELMMYYGVTTQLVYSCDGAINWQPFAISATSIRGECTMTEEDQYQRVYITAVVTATKALKPFRIPLQIDGKTTAFEYVPVMVTAGQQSFTAFSNTEVAFNITSNFVDKIELDYNGTPCLVEIDTTVEFTTPVAYHFYVSQFPALAEESLRCTAYNGNKKMQMSTFSNGNSNYMFKDKKVQIAAHGGDEVVLVCAIDINPHPKYGNPSVGMQVRDVTNSQWVQLSRNEEVTSPNEDWLAQNYTTVVYTEAIYLTHMMSPAPKSVDEAKQRVVKLLKTAKPLGEEDEHLSGFKNITTKDVYLSWWMNPMHEVSKFSALTAANGLGKVLEFNKRFNSAQAFGGEDNRMIVWAYVNTTAAPGLAASLPYYQFTAANADEGFEMDNQSGAGLYIHNEVTYIQPTTLAETVPQWGYDQGWKCFTAFQCDGYCVDGVCQWEQLPIEWTAQWYYPSDPFQDLSGAYDEIQSTSARTGESNAAFDVSGVNMGYLMTLCVVIIAGMMF